MGDRRSMVERERDQVLEMQAREAFLSRTNAKLQPARTVTIEGVEYWIRWDGDLREILE